MAFQAKIYSTKPLPDEMRTDFELPSWPYHNSKIGPALPDTEAYFKELGIFRYQSQDHSLAVLIDMQNKEGEWVSPTKMFVFQAYVSIPILSDAEFKIIEWRLEHFSHKPKLLDEQHDKFGDYSAWIIWNKPEMVNVITNRAVSIIDNRKNLKHLKGGTPIK